MHYFKTTLFILLFLFTSGLYKAQAQWGNWIQTTFMDDGESAIICSSDQAIFYLKQVDYMNGTSPHWGNKFYYSTSNNISWVQGPNLPVPCPLAVFAIGDKVYSIFINRKFYVYDISDNTWTQLADSPFSNCSIGIMSMVNAATVVNNKAYVIASNDPNDGYGIACTGGTMFYMWEYDPASGQWTQRTQMPVPTSRRFDMTCFSIGQKIYAGLGYDSQDRFDFWEYNPANHTWTRKADFPGGARHSAVGFDICGRGYLVGGSVVSPHIWKYSPDTDQWSQGPGLINPYNGNHYSMGMASACRWKNKVYVLSVWSMEYIYEYSPTPELSVYASSTSLCSGQTLQVPYHVCDISFNPSNVFTVQLSNASGSFANPITIGTASGTTSGVITTTIPSNTVYGTGYRIRIVASSPAMTSYDNGVNITINPTKNVSYTFGTRIIYINSNPVALSGGIPAGGSYSGPGVSNNIFNPAQAGVGTHIITYTYNSCSPTAQASITVVDCEYENDVRTWQTKQNFPGNVRQEAVSFSIGNKGYLCTGYGTPVVYYNDLWEWNQATNNWIQRGNMPAVGRMGAVGGVINGKFYIGLGMNSSGTCLNDFWEWNPALGGIWTQMPAFPQARKNSVAFVIGNTIYVGTGTTATSAKTTFWKWTPGSSSWTACAALPSSARHKAIGFSTGGKGYIGLGLDNNSAALNDFWEYDPISDSWVQKANYPGVGRSNAEAVGASNGDGYVGFGWIASGSLMSTDIYKWNQINGWTQMTNLPGTPTQSPAMFVIGDYVYVTGSRDVELREMGRICDQRFAFSYATPPTYCAGANFYIQASALGTFNAGNIFRVYLSDASGSFANQVSIGAYSATQFSSFPVTIPAGTTPGNGYRFKIVSSDPVEETISYFTCNITNCNITAPVITGSTFCVGNAVPITFTTNGFPAEAAYIVQLSDATGSFANPRQLVFPQGAAGTYNVTAYLQAPLAAGNNYRIRVTASNPSSVVSPDNGTDLVISDQCISYLFDGTDDRINIPDNTAYSFGTGNFSVGAWIRANNVQSQATSAIVSKRSGNTDGFLFATTNQGKQLLLRIGNTVVTSSEFTSVWDNNCHSVLVTRSGSTITFYKDGSAVGTATLSNNVNSTVPLLLGLDVAGASPFCGRINEIRMWNTTKTGAFMNGGVSPGDPNLIGWFNFKEISGLSVNDGSSIANHGSLGTDAFNLDNADPQRSNMPCHAADREGSFEPEMTNEISVYPNPFKQSFTVSIHNSDGYSYILTDLHGKKVMEGNIYNTNQEISSENLVNGMYLLKLTNDSGESKIFKLIKAE